MQAKQLIAMLQSLPPETQVQILFSRYDGDSNVVETDEPELWADPDCSIAMLTAPEYQYWLELEDWMIARPDIFTPWHKLEVPPE